VVLAHPQALAQCQGWLSQHLPRCRTPCGVQQCRGCATGATNPAWAGLASERAASQFGLHIVAHAIQDEAYNRTRFAVICLPQTLAMPPAPGKDCTSLVVSVPNRPGAVHDLLVPLKNHGVSMTRFESRPAKSGQWEYYFLHRHCRAIRQQPMWRCLNELQSLCAFYKVLGAYPTGLTRTE
jgi:chorismate mutase/prephenate dehydratase